MGKIKEFLGYFVTFCFIVGLIFIVVALIYFASHIFLRVVDPKTNDSTKISQKEVSMLYSLDLEEKEINPYVSCGLTNIIIETDDIKAASKEIRDVWQRKNYEFKGVCCVEDFLAHEKFKTFKIIEHGQCTIELEHYN